MFGRFALEKLFKQIQGGGHKPQPVQNHGFHRYPGADLLVRILAHTLIHGLNHAQLIDNTRDDSQMIYGLDDDIDKTLLLDTMLMRIIAHYSECDNLEGGMWGHRRAH